MVSADGAVLINLRRINDVSIDAGTSSAVVGGGSQWQDVVDAAAEVGLAPLAGSSPNVGVVGYTLGGGVSPTLGRAHGFAADWVQWVEIVTPDGQLRRVDRDNEPELFWAVRGGKGNFGVVTRMRFQMVPTPPLFGGGLYFAAEHVGPVLAAFQDVVAHAPDGLSISFAFLRLPDAPFVPEFLRGRFTLHVRVAYLGSAAEGEKLIAPLRAAAPPMVDTVAEMPFAAIAGIHADPVDPLPAYERGTFLRELPTAAIEALVNAAGPETGTPLVMVEVRHLGGALARPPSTPSAVLRRDASFQLFVAAVGDPGMDEAFRPEIQSVLDAMRPWSAEGSQINFLTAYDTNPEGVRAAYGPDVFDRLARIKHRYDQGNMFRINHNIAPAN
ncbi:FAD-linked oxidase [Asanoa siamensis]|uniref:FAD-linked oxidase n=1 Tax=Asanoa siamensis TaxID=926357 RepID=A0ABQ4D2F1_9ACTN|nr:FAD-linked oxidase [Asanoa siamensis]